MIFGLSSAHVAATFAAVMVGYNVIWATRPTASRSAFERKRAQRHDPDDSGHLHGRPSPRSGRTTSPCAMRRTTTNSPAGGPHPHSGRHEQTGRRTGSLSDLKKAKSRNGLYALNAIDNKVEDPRRETGRKILDTAAKAAAASDIYLQALLRYDVTSPTPSSAWSERSITDIVMGMHHDRTPGGSGIGRMAADVLARAMSPPSLPPRAALPTIKRHLVSYREGRKGGRIPDVDSETRTSPTIRAPDLFYAPENTMQYLRPKAANARPTRIRGLQPVGRPHGAHLRDQTRRLPVVVMSRRERVSYHPAMSKVPPAWSNSSPTTASYWSTRTGRRHGDWLYKISGQYSLSCSFTECVPQSPAHLVCPPAQSGSPRWAWTMLK
ncbi:MAG: hypothetical protein ACLRMJ_05820 [Alistipes finegoldii]